MDCPMTTGFDTALKVCNYAASLPRYDKLSNDYIYQHHCDRGGDDDGEQVQGGGQLLVGRPRPAEHRCQARQAESA